MTTTKSKLMYRIFLYEGATQLCESLALMAARSNGSDSGIHFDIIAAAAKSVPELNPKEHPNTTVEIIGANCIVIDMKQKGWDEYKTVLKIEQVEILEPIFTEE